MMNSYFEPKTIKIIKTKINDMTTGVPQGAVLWPFLWNLLYDQVLNVTLSKASLSVVYADNVIIMMDYHQRVTAQVLKVRARYGACPTKN